MKKNLTAGLRKAGVIASTALVSMHAAAQTAPASGGPDLSALTSAIAFDTVKTAVVSIAAALGVVYVAVKGARIALAMIRR